MEHYFKHKKRTGKFWQIVGMIFLGIIAAIGFAFLFGYIIMILWNWLMPDIFGLAEIGYWQAVGIIIFAKLIFGGFSGHKKHSKNCNEIKYSKYKKSRKTSNGFSKWKYYDKFWKEKGENAFKEYIKTQANDADFENDENFEDDKTIKD